jgi:hypothetical protein
LRTYKLHASLLVSEPEAEFLSYWEAGGLIMSREIFCLPQLEGASELLEGRAQRHY